MDYGINLNTDCASLNQQLRDLKKQDLDKAKASQKAALFNSSGLDVLVRNLLNNAGDVLGERYKDLLEKEVINKLSVDTYVGAAVSTYLLALVSIPNLILIIPYLTIQNLKKYIKIRIDSVNYIYNALVDLEKILNRIPLSGNTRNENVQELRLALNHVKKSINLLNLYKERMRAAIEAQTGYVSPSLLTKGTNEVDQAIISLNKKGIVGTTASEGVSDAELDQLLKDFEQDLEESIGKYGVSLIKDYIRQYGVFYLLLLKYVKKIAGDSNISINSLLENYKDKSIESLASINTIINISDDTSKLFESHPATAGITVSPIIKTYVGSLSTILKTLDKIEDSSKLLSSLLPAAFLPIDGALGILNKVKTDLETDIRGNDSASVFKSIGIESSRSVYTTELDGAKTLLIGYLPDQRRSSNKNSLDRTANLLYTLQAIEDYINNDYPKDHPIGEIEKEVFRLVKAVVRTAFNADFRTNVVSSIKSCKKACKKSLAVDNKLLSLLEAYSIEEESFFEETFASYNRISNIFNSFGNNILSPTQNNLFTELKMGIPDSIVVGISSASMLTGLATGGASDINGSIPFNNVGSQITSAIANFRCANRNPNILRELSEKSPVQQEEETIDTYYDNELAKLNTFDLENYNNTGWTKHSSF